MEALPHEDLELDIGLSLWNTVKLYGFRIEI
jgi:hypothetical protein